MDQWEISDALTVYLETGNIEPWRRILDAIPTGDVTAESRANTLTFKAITRPATVKFGRRMAELRIQSGMTLNALAEVLDISLSAVIRQMAGRTLTHWPTAKMMIEAMGGDPAEYKEDHLAAKAENRRYSKTSGA